MATVYSKATKKKICTLENKVAKHREQIRILEDQIEEIKVGESPIQPNDLVVWYTGNRKYRGKVISIKNKWGGDYEYRVRRLSKNNAAIGFANVDAKNQIALEGYEDE